MAFPFPLDGRHIPEAFSENEFKNPFLITFRGRRGHGFDSNPRPLLWPYYTTVFFVYVITFAFTHKIQHASVQNRWIAWQESVIH